MASFDPADHSPSESDSETGEGTDTGEDEEDEGDTRGRTSRPTSAHIQGTPCRYYNSGNCRGGSDCRYLHFCKYALQGSCRNGSRCPLKHPRGGRTSSKETCGAKTRSRSRGKKLDDGRFYQWQLDDGKGWKDIANNHIIEAQYSLPYTKGIKIYNTPYGAVIIDFKKMSVRGKDLRVRRLDDGQTVWVWFWSSRDHGYVKYGDKGSKGNSASGQSSDIERKYQSNAVGSFTFNVASDTIEIKFREMQQVSDNRKRKVARRPQYRHPRARSLFSEVASRVKQVFLSSRPGAAPQWQFEGRAGNWYSFKDGSNIETKYQQDKHGSMMITVNGQSYKVDFRAMTQINQSTGKRRKIRRI